MKYSKLLRICLCIKLSKQRNGWNDFNIKLNLNKLKLLIKSEKEYQNCDLFKCHSSFLWHKLLITDLKTCKFSGNFLFIIFYLKKTGLMNWFGIFIVRLLTTLMEDFVESDISVYIYTIFVSINLPCFLYKILV